MASNIEVKLDVLNQLASPALYAAALANRPAASFTGRLFVDSDSPSTGIYRDTGSTWIQIADPGAGTTGTLQQVTTNGNTSNVGISVTANGIGIGTTIPTTNRLDIHAASGIQATFNGTGTTNSALQFQLAGTGKWNLGNLYNSSANDFIITDVVNTLNRLTIKNTGQTFIGADTTSSGLFVVNSASSDSHIVVLGANSPSIRIRDSGSSLVQNVGLGISTGTNAFIQGSASGNYCIFNSSTTASPILFGIYDAGTGNTQEAARISEARNFLIGGTVNNGKKLQVSGDVTANIYYVPSSVSGGGYLFDFSGNCGFGVGTIGQIIQFYAGGSERMRLNTAGNLLIKTTTDNGATLQVNGSCTLNGTLRFYDFIGATSNYWECYQYNDNTLRFNYNGSGGDEFVLTNTGDIQILYGSIKTASPSGGSSKSWKLGNYTAGVAVQAGTVKVEIDGVVYNLLTS